jgi:hypothetical protein
MYIVLIGTRGMHVIYWWKEDLDEVRRKIRKYLREMGWGDMEWLNLTQDTDEWRALVNTVMDSRVP